MNCFQFRRLLLAEPRQLTPEQKAHRDECASCARLVRSVEQLEERLEKAALVPVPEGLAERVLLRHKISSPNRWGTLALAASLAIAVGVGLHFAVFSDRSEPVLIAERVDVNHPAVAAISYVQKR